MKKRSVIARRYEVQRRLGRGAWGEVFLVADLARPGIEVALKTRRIDPHGTSEARGALARGFRTLTRIHHPNLARVYDLGLTREPGAGLSQIYFTRQYVEGVDFVEALAGAGPEAVLEATVALCQDTQDAPRCVSTGARAHHASPASPHTLAPLLDTAPAAQLTAALTTRDRWTPCGRVSTSVPSVSAIFAPSAFNGQSFP